jgi:3-hydroxyacyl-[acyl-carrier-protein] dehydratase
MMKDEICVEKIMERIPHRYPFLFVDKVISYNRSKDIVAKKNVTINEPFFSCNVSLFISR